MQIEWIAEDDESLARATKVTIEGKSAVAPHQATESIASSPALATSRRDEVALSKDGLPSPKDTIVVAGEQVRYSVLEGVGYKGDVTSSLMTRLKSLVVSGKINLVYTRLPEEFHDADRRPLPYPTLDDLRISGLVAAQLEADASLIIPPLPTGISSSELADRVLERTWVELQSSTRRDTTSIVGYIPTTTHTEVVGHLIERYVKMDIRFFAVDFSGAPNHPALIRPTVTQIRKNLRIRNKPRRDDERYYLHVFDVPAQHHSAKKAVVPLADLLIHPYGVDSTSLPIFGGGGVPSLGRLRFYNTEDYGAYRKSALQAGGLREKPVSCGCAACKNGKATKLFAPPLPRAMLRLRQHRICAHASECRQITDCLSSGKAEKGYVPYLGTKVVAKPQINSILSDVREIRALLR
jgi:hypothetical protein